MDTRKNNGSQDANDMGRRSFIKGTGAAMIGGALAYNLGFPNEAFAANKGTLKVGLIGCGGRGTGATIQALTADPDVVLTAMGDVFPDRLEEAYAAITKVKPDEVKVPRRRQYIGFDAYQKVIDSGVDVVILTTPPAFRPGHLEAAIAAGKHVFCEKPVAVDAPGVRKVLAAAKEAKAKNLSLMSGFCFRRDYANMAAFGKVLDGAIGDVRTVTTFRNGGELWTKPRQPDWTDMVYKMRNWYYHDWLSGDFIVEQAVHSIDMMSWAMGDRLPVRATGTGGRQRRVDEIYGNIYDHFAIEYEYADGAKGIHFCRQQAGTTGRNTVEVAGTLGNANFMIGREHVITGKNPWKYEGENNNMFQAEHDELFASIRSGKPVNDGEWMANSTMLAILGKMVGYSGQSITLEEAFNSELAIGPKLEEYDWDLVWETQPVAVPGITKVL
ncbi:putative dehydrogenase [Anseongella ginsenosidimutans]|uniref:Putative dehydrogenase n=1 Tax=Anseongella ginsenosidimutans TaxID=496056 RepID=A0A4R3KXQ9_9SPHI|nr:Gfo/Idh/MocA family oxidoreductase [Anseongella ginsenosidimutans]TCS89250.1 putative dehydrogenase [Anseongella ginsenosidimutans]